MLQRPLQVCDFLVVHFHVNCLRLKIPCHQVLGFVVYGFQASDLRFFQISCFMFDIF